MAEALDVNAVELEEYPSIISMQARQQRSRGRSEPRAAPRHLLRPSCCPDDSIPTTSSRSLETSSPHRHGTTSPPAQRRCVGIISDLFNLPDGCSPAGTATIGSTEAVMLALLAMKARWQRRRAEQGKPADKPNLVVGHNCQARRWRTHEDGRLPHGCLNSSTAFHMQSAAGYGRCVAMS